MAEKYMERYESFVKSVESLKRARERDLSDEFVLSGTVQKFCLTFDISWKVMKDLLVHYHGVGDFATGSPRETLRAAAGVGLIADDRWMTMLKDRNNLSHDYDGSLAAEKGNVILQVYLPLFEAFEEQAKNTFSRMQSL